MRQRFDETFARVSAVFSEMFTILFGGGTARLVLVAGENGDGAGIDIVAQPPGKRLQSLALLSGGERSLTAAALLFAILSVNPTPFCLLDEVDAALDEANIVRFREQLQALAARNPGDRHHPQPRHHRGRRHPLRRQHARRRRLPGPVLAPGRRGGGGMNAWIGRKSPHLEV